jgi:hypothetical protein
LRAGSNSLDIDGRSENRAAFIVRAPARAGVRHPGSALAKPPLVVTIEVRRVVVPDPIGRARRVTVVRDEQPSSLLQTNLLLDLQGLMAVAALKW